MPRVDYNVLFEFYPVLQWSIYIGNNEKSVSLSFIFDKHKTRFSALDRYSYDFCARRSACSARKTQKKIPRRAQVFAQFSPSVEASARTCCVNVYNTRPGAHHWKGKKSNPFEKENESSLIFTPKFYLHLEFRLIYARINTSRSPSIASLVLRICFVFVPSADSSRRSDVFDVR